IAVEQIRRLHDVHVGVDEPEMILHGILLNRVCAGNGRTMSAFDKESRVRSDGTRTSPLPGAPHTMASWIGPRPGFQRLASGSHPRPGRAGASTSGIGDANTHFSVLARPVMR